MFVDEKPQGEVIEQPAKVLKLSEAMRIGAEKTGHCLNVYTDGQFNTCAIGAAYVGLGLDPTMLMDTERDGWGADPAACLHGPAFALSMAGIQIIDSMANRIVAMNDSGASREQIADWLETQ